MQENAQDTTFDPVVDGRTLNVLKHHIRQVVQEVMALEKQYPPCLERREVIHEVSFLLSELAVHNLAPTQPNRCEICGDHDCSSCGMCHNRDVDGERCKLFIAPGTDCAEFSVDQEEEDNAWSAVAH